MHIQEGTNTTLTTCTKMTEEVDRRHGVNGNSSSKGASEDAPVHSATLASTGGRLKFFKDGKFILELVRGCGREGERAGWVSVPRKTFWPPAAAPPTPPHPPLSASDDNSSVQSSPWQRDHCWKQASPRRNLSKELAMYYCRPATLLTPVISAASRAKRRRPHDPALPDAPPNPPRRPANGFCDHKRNGDADSPESAGDGSSADDRWPDHDREKYYHMKLKKPYQYHKLRVYKKTRSAFRRKELARVADRLRARAAAAPTPAPAPAPFNAKLASCRQEHMMVSPRKRILRELERVSLEEQGSKRRAKTVPALSTASYPPSPGPSAPAPAAPRALNGSARREPPLTKNASSYSIHSLLSMPEEGKRSPLAPPEPPAGHSPSLSPSPDSYRYRYGALALGSPGAGAGGVARDSPPPPPYRGGFTPFAARPCLPYRPELPYVYGYGYAGGVYRAPAPPPLWMHYAPPGPWAPLAHPHALLTDHIPKEEPTSDLPLNLSKH